MRILLSQSPGLPHRAGLGVAYHTEKTCGKKTGDRQAPMRNGRTVSGRIVKTETEVVCLWHQAPAPPGMSITGHRICVPADEAHGNTLKARTWSEVIPATRSPARSPGSLIAYQAGTLISVTVKIVSFCALCSFNFVVQSQGWSIIF